MCYMSFIKGFVPAIGPTGRAFYLKRFFDELDRGLYGSESVKLAKPFSFSHGYVIGAACADHSLDLITFDCLDCFIHISYLLSGLALL